MVFIGLRQAEALLDSELLTHLPAWEAPPGVEVKGLRCGQDSDGVLSFGGVLTFGMEMSDDLQLIVDRSLVQMREWFCSGLPPKGQTCGLGILTLGCLGG